MDQDAFQGGDRIFEALLDARRDLVDLDDGEPFIECAVEGDLVPESTTADRDVVTARLPGDLVRDLPDGIHQSAFLGRDIIVLADAGPAGF